MDLYYFDGYGRGDVIRILLSHANQPFTDHRIFPSVYFNTLFMTL